MRHDPDVGATGFIWSERLPYSPNRRHGLVRCDCIARNRSWRTWHADDGSESGIEFRTNGWGFVHPCPESALRARLYRLCHAFRPWDASVEPAIHHKITQSEFTRGVEYAVEQWKLTRLKA